MLTIRITARITVVVRPGGRPAAIGLARSIAMVVCLMRKNVTQDVAGAIFGVSQATASRRWDLLRPLIGDVLSDFVPDPKDVVGNGTVLVDGTVCPTWDWKAVPDLFSKKVGYPGMNIQISANLNGDVAAIGPIPIHGARHDAYAFEASGLKAILAGMDPLGDLGYVGVDGVEMTPIKRSAGKDLNAWQAKFNRDLSGIRAATERANASVKTWRMLSEEGGRFRPPLHKYESMLKAITGLFFFRKYYTPCE